jgi:hypothetical protein
MRGPDQQMENLLEWIILNTFGMLLPQAVILAGNQFILSNLAPCSAANCWYLSGYFS